ncbi:helix-turn-helix domain-containing protein [Pseudonocardia benzenivorans]|uniref:Helix-turn-helix domain-containing protein n=1 Tax=Pseudonocardia benzenivorans TaxID=228005 RepID=A0ABW3VM04_9PSEU
MLASAQGRSATEAAAMFAAKPQYARNVIHAFNAEGFAALDLNGAGAGLESSVPRPRVDLSGRSDSAVAHHRQGSGPGATARAVSPPRPARCWRRRGEKDEPVPWRAA